MKTSLLHCTYKELNIFIMVYLFWYCLPYPMTFIRKKQVKGMPWNMCYLKLNHRNIKTRISLTKQSVYSQMKDNDTIYWRKDQYHHQIHIKLLHRQHYCDTYNYANTGIKKIDLIKLTLCRCRAYYQRLLMVY